MRKIFPLIIFIFLLSCKHDPSEPIDDKGYPKEVAEIIVNKCATAGCHNTESRVSAGGLDYSTWDVMFDGGRNGNSVIPFSVDYSYMLYSINTDSLRGPVLIPTMPYLRTHLSDADYNTLYNWIADGAPNNKGFIKYSDDPLRRKIYICMQGCDQVAVMDARTKNIMRYVEVGVLPGIESPHQVRVSDDGNYWYVVFYAGNILQKFRTSDDALVATLTLDNISHNWNTLIFTPDGQTGFVNALDGFCKVVNLDNMTITTTLGALSSPHGGFVSPDGDSLYLTCQNGNFIYKINITDGLYDFDMISLVPGQLPITSSSLQPHEAILSPDGSKYFVSCQGTAEVRVFQLSNDSLLAVIPVGAKPQELSVSETYPYIFVSCTEEIVSSNSRGKVYVIDYNTLNIVSSIYTGYQPHGIAVDDIEGLVYVANLNYDPNGNTPHHVSSCGGRNGYLSIIDLQTLQLYNKTLSDGNSFQYKNELLAFPYFVSLRK